MATHKVKGKGSLTTAEFLKLTAERFKKTIVGPVTIL